jgi:hypothetical protein
MFGFLQGFAYGLLVSCPAWFMLGMFRPDLAAAGDPPSRIEVIVRYWFAIPFLVFLTWITSLWGGFSPTLAGWLAGLAAIPLELAVERRWRRWRARRKELAREAARDAEAARQRAALEQEEREAGLLVLDPASPPVDADEIVRALCEAKRELLDARRPDLATQVDRLFTRYRAVLDVLGRRFDTRELTYERARGMVVEVCRGTLDTLTAMGSLARGVAGIDVDFVRRRLARAGTRLAVAERQALERRLELVASTEARLIELSGHNEAALTALDDTAVAVAAIETGRPQASVTAELALGDLRHFAARAGRYARNGGSGT